MCNSAIQRPLSLNLNCLARSLLSCIIQGTSDLQTASVSAQRHRHGRTAQPSCNDRHTTQSGLWYKGSAIAADQVYWHSHHAYTVLSVLHQTACATADTLAVIQSNSDDMHTPALVFCCKQAALPQTVSAFVVKDLY